MNSTYPSILRWLAPFPERSGSSHDILRVNVSGVFFVSFIPVFAVLFSIVLIGVRVVFVAAYLAVLAVLQIGVRAIRPVPCPVVCLIVGRVVRAPFA
jgi:hypothetical protein